jgi:hypothetical protein
MGEKLRNILREIIWYVWETKRMPEDCRVGIISSIHKKRR